MTTGEGRTQDSKKTKIQLIEELENLRTRLAELDKENEAEIVAKPSSAGCQLRRKLRAEIKFIGDFGLMKASGINLSEGGICFEVEGDIPFEMEFEIDGQKHEQRAHLIWVSQVAKGRSQLGFKFVLPESDETSALLWLYKELDLLDELGEET